MGPMKVRPYIRDDLYSVELISGTYCIHVTLENPFWVTGSWVESLGKRETE